MTRPFQEREAIRLFQGGRSVDDAARITGSTREQVAHWVSTCEGYRPQQTPGRLDPPAGPMNAELRRREPEYFARLESITRQCEVESIDAECDACTATAERLEASGLPDEAKPYRSMVLAMVRRRELLLAIDAEPDQE